MEDCVDVLCVVAWGGVSNLWLALYVVVVAIIALWYFSS